MMNISVASILLNHQARSLAQLPPTATVRDALELMEKLDIGSVLIMQGEALLGLFTERDYARKIALKGLSSVDAVLANVMTERLYVVSPRQTAQECLAIMTQARVRHLPVLDAGAVVGLISIGDLVNAELAQQRYLIAQLETYIAGNMA